MSANLPNTDIPSDHLDHTVHQNEVVSSVSIIESSVTTISVSVAEIKSDEVRVSSGGGSENLVEVLPQSSDLRVEEKLKEEVVVGVGGGHVDDDSVVPEVSGNGNEERESEIEVVKVESTVVITESSSSVVDRNEVGGEIEVMEKEGVSEAKNEVSEINDLDGNPSCVEKDGSLEAETVEGSSGAGLNDESTSQQDEKQETVALVAETVSDQVDSNERSVLDSVKENQSDGATVNVDSNSVVEVFDGSQGVEVQPGSPSPVTESAGLPHPNGDLSSEENNSVEADKQDTVALFAETVSDMIDSNERSVLDSVTENQSDGATVNVDSNSVVEVTVTQVTESVSSQVDDYEKLDSHSTQENLDELTSVTTDSSSFLEVSHVYNASGVEVVQVECSTVVTESLVEQTQVVEGGEVAMKDSEEVLERTEVVPRTDGFGEYPPSLEKNQSTEAQAVGGSMESHGDMDICSKDNTSRVDEKLEMVGQVLEATSNKLDANMRLHTDTVEENLDEGASVTVDSNSFAESYDGCATSNNGGVSCSAQVTEFVSGMVDGNLGSDVHINEGHAPDKEQKTGVETAEAGCSMVVNELQVEQIQVVGGDKDLQAQSVGGSTESFPNGNVSCEVSTLIQAEKQDVVAQAAEPVSDQVDGAETMDSCLVNESLDKEVFAIPDGSQGEGGSTGCFSNGNLGRNENTSMQAGKQDMAPQVVGSVSDQVDRVETMDLCPVNEDLDKAVCATIDPSSLSKIPDGCQNADSGVQDTLGEEGRKTGIEVVKAGGLTETNELVVEQIQVIVGGEVAKVDNEDVSKTNDIFSGTDALDVNPRPETSQNLGADVVDTNPDSEVQVAEGQAAEELESRIEVVNKECSTVIPEPLVDRTSDSEVQVTEGHALGDKKSETTIEAVKPEYSIAITEPVVDHIDDVGGGVTVLENKEVLETESLVADTNTLDATSSSLEKNKSLQAEAVGESTESYPCEDLSDDVNASVQEEKHEMVAQVAEIVSNPVDEDPAFENPIENDYVIVDSNSFAMVSNGSEASVSCAPSTESAGSLLDEKLDSEVEATENHASEDENQKSEAVRVGCSELINEALVEQNQVGHEVAVVKNEEDSKTKGSVSGADLLDGGSSFPEKDRSWQAETNLHPVEDPIKGDCVTVDSSLADVFVNGSQVTGGYLDSETQRHAAVLHEDQNMATHVSVIDAFPGVVNQNSEVVVMTESVGGSSKAEGSQIMESHLSQVGVSEVSVNECIIGIPDEDLGTSDEVVKQAIYPPDNSEEKRGGLQEIEGDMEFFELDCLDEVQTDDAIDVGDRGNDKVEIGEQVAGFEQANSMEQQLEKAEAKSEPTATYHLTPEKEGEFSISDLVWGKVRSHPWWPGQIFNSSDASEQAMKYHKKDNFLVAYFGDQSFAWNEASAMKPFRTHFSQMEKQNSSESFRVAVNGALDEVRRRVELGMTCFCTPEEIYAKVKSQVIKNPGIREEARRKDGLVKNLSGTSFQPGDLVHYIKELALNPLGGGDRLELVIAQAQLLAFYRFKGHFWLPEFHVYRGLSESDLDISSSRELKNSEGMGEPATQLSENEEQAASVEVKLKNHDNTSRKRKQVPEDNLCSSRKERSLSDLMAGKKPDNDSQNHADAESPAPQSFKVGECIRRIASQLTGAPSILKSSGESLQNHEGSHKRKIAIPKEYSCPDEMLSQLCLAARDPMKGYSFLTIIIGFFSDFRNSISLDRPSLRKHKKSEQVGIGNMGSRKSISSKISSAETFDFEDSSDTYWTDRIVQNTADEQTADKNHDRNEESELQTTPTEKDDMEPGNALQLYESKEQNLDGVCDLPLNKSSRKNRKRKGGSRVGDGNPEKSLHTNDKDLPVKKPRKPRKKQGESLETPTDKDGDKLNNVDPCHDKNSPTALLLNFTKPHSALSEANLNKIFRRFGPLKELETEVLRDTNSARVVFKTRNDAEVALSSAEKFSIFGPVVVTYQLIPFLLTPYKPSLCITPQGREDATSVEWNTA